MSRLVDAGHMTSTRHAAALLCGPSRAESRSRIEYYFNTTAAPVRHATTPIETRPRRQQKQGEAAAVSVVFKAGSSWIECVFRTMR
eukprot:364495-Chlamydomonas_euryale.AAC.11